MLNRRGLEVVILTIMLTRPVFGGIRLWSVKTMGSSQPGSPLHLAAEVLSILT